ncbi:hypothetical protein TNCV_3708091 [Trichonephila clavipes]|nr:hypothetical protein TNCV_3708091 [Trichonephila clavipes]
MVINPSICQLPLAISSRKRFISRIERVEVSSVKSPEKGCGVRKYVLSLWLPKREKTTVTMTISGHIEANLHPYPTNICGLYPASKADWSPIVGVISWVCGF